MLRDSSAPPCPRCGAPFPNKASVCPNCGLTQEVAQDPFWRSSAPTPTSDFQAQDQSYSTQRASGPVPGDPFAHARRSQPYEAYSVGYADAPPKHSFWRSLWVLAVVAFLLVLVVGVSAFAIFFYPSLCSAQQRNNLEQDIPLPCGITFLNHLDRSASGTTGPGSQEWVYSVDSQTPAQIISFYQSKLPNDGWALPSTIQGVDNNALAACKGQTAALIRSTNQATQETADFTFQPPPGGSLLLIILAPLKNLIPQIQQACLTHSETGSGGA